ncbi:MAG TPA: sugar ABC transporter permease [bacterium]|nr:sugar ABC transporter permease [bacterium]
MDRLLPAALALVGAPAASVAYILAAELALGRLPDRRRTALRPWVWTAPALLFVAVFLVYPTLDTLALSFRDAADARWVGAANYVYTFQSREALVALRNTLVWLVVFTGLVVAGGLGIAVLAERVRYDAVVRAIVFLPMALSFTAAGVIWKFVYEFRPAGAPQIGLLNAVLGAAFPGFDPRAWLVGAPWNTLFLIVVAVWIWIGFATAVFAAALKAVPAAMFEAARVDGAGEWRVFVQIALPAIGPTTAAVATAMVITALKVFDVVYVMTSGNYDTDVLANRMYRELFVDQHLGRAGALAVLLLAATAPAMVANLRRLRREAETR